MFLDEMYTKVDSGSVVARDVWSDYQIWQVDSGSNTKYGRNGLYEAIEALGYETYIGHGNKKMIKGLKKRVDSVPDSDDF
jgi:hypothetical protein